MISPLVQLVAICFLQISIHAIVVGFVPPDSLIRPALLPTLLLCVYHVIPICLEATGTVLSAALAGAFSISSLFQYIDIALVSRWTATTQGPTRVTKGSTYDLSARSAVQPTYAAKLTAWERLRFGYFTSLSTRKVGTPYQVPGVPPFSAKDPQHVPSSRAFLLHKATVVFISYIVLDFSTAISQPDQNPKLFHAKGVSWLNPENLVFEQLLVRIVSVLGFWINLYFVIQAQMATAAIVMVGIGASKVDCWPPGFDPISEAYSIRRFWGGFWHKYQQQKMASPAGFITNSVLRLPQNSLSSRYAQLFVTFWISGLMHALNELPQGIPWEHSGAIRFFCTQAVGIVLEDAIQAAYRQALSRRKGGPSTRRSFTIMGYLWVAMFLIWSTLVWIYPGMSQNTGQAKDRVVPLSLIQAVGKIF